MSTSLKFVVFCIVVLTIVGSNEATIGNCLIPCNRVNCPLTPICEPGEISTKTGPCGCCRSCIEPTTPTEPIPCSVQCKGRICPLYVRPCFPGGPGPVIPPGTCICCPTCIYRDPIPIELATSG